ncbi:piggyBac transposable element-derived protein 3-like, partial [Belonocnema kinseyi]|uniref:piggyBac transposable element-derived protein 3-like n=1 Tax=Belonocnema kinseyi TaxID=2817044 RepID=UPI00143D0081
MPKRKNSAASNATKKRRIDTVESNEKENYVEAVFIPNPDDSSESDAGHSENELSSEEDMDIDYDEIPVQSYEKVSENYSAKQKKLEDGHVYKWVDEEMKYNENLRIIIFTMFNKRLSQRYYWSTDPLLRSEPVAKAMGRQEFEKIKSQIKFHKLADEDPGDKAWRVRQLLNIFNKNIKQFGYFCTALCVDEMMIKFYGKICFKQFIQAKPIRFGIKEWALCGSNGYLFHFDIYCGKNAKEEFLPKIAQGSRVVLQMLRDFFLNTSPRNRRQYHVYFDNLFCCPDLLVHLKNQYLRATGIVRKDRIQESHQIDAKAPRGTTKAKHVQNSGMNFITVVDSKPVSLLSTAAGITPTSN